MSHVSNLRIVSLWATMYADWEEGRQTSPSSDDLVRVAEGVWGVRFDEWTADEFFEYTQDGTSLEQQADWLAARIPPDPATALSFDQVEAAGLDGTLRDM